jgi:hypothetical protein
MMIPDKSHSVLCQMRNNIRKHLLPPSSGWNMTAACSSEITISVNQSALRHMLQESNAHSRHQENLKCDTLTLVTHLL